MQHQWKGSKNCLPLKKQILRIYRKQCHGLRVQASILKQLEIVTAEFLLLLLLYRDQQLFSVWTIPFFDQGEKTA